MSKAKDTVADKQAVEGLLNGALNARQRREVRRWEALGKGATVKQLLHRLERDATV